ncbi:C-type lectin domain family 18 member C-like isoform X2 [Anneissia japonica]|uniref:C-type lectin domain family 18 member C-like isoform X2 n=1 Tax=Anneissia japonica TaxID=1529436 RepID=UPI0014254D64|nr:C-type lectin domain family 18 member C-like isoform X2 [Anneissia japonica]
MNLKIWLFLMFTSCSFWDTLALFDDFQIGIPNSNGGTTAWLTTEVPTTYSSNSVPISADLEKAEILEGHNNGRRSVDPEASNMNIVAWDDELYSAAQASTDTCHYTITTSTDFERSRKVVQFAGITQAESFRLSMYVSILFALGDHYTYATKECSVPVDYCNVYKLLAWAEMTKMGCAQTFCSVLYDTQNAMNRTDIWYFKCNYEEIGRYDTLDSYLVGEQCTECSSGSGWCNTGLCDATCTSSNESCSCELNSDCSFHGSVDNSTCRCACDSGYSGDDCEIESRILINLCMVENARVEGLCSSGNECEHICTVDADGYICSCNSSYILFYDEVSCVLDVCAFGTYCNMNGLLDEDTCTCHCFSGYKGEFCNSTCNIDESSCWKDYPSPVVRYNGNACPIYSPSIDCNDEFICINGGYLEKQSGFEEVPGMCRCYCHFPWSGATCEDCNLECVYGTLNQGNCTCSCNDGYYGVDCSSLCKQTSLLCTRHTEGRCDHNVIRKHCPIMCGVCVPL